MIDSCGGSKIECAWVEWWRMHALPPGKCVVHNHYEYKMCRTKIDNIKIPRFDIFQDHFSNDLKGSGSPRRPSAMWFRGGKISQLSTEYSHSTLELNLCNRSPFCFVVFYRWSEKVFPILLPQLQYHRFTFSLPFYGYYWLLVFYSN